MSFRKHREITNIIEIRKIYCSYYSVALTLLKSLALMKRQWKNMIGKVSVCSKITRLYVYRDCNNKDDEKLSKFFIGKQAGR